MIKKGHLWWKSNSVFKKTFFMLLILFTVLLSIFLGMLTYVTSHSLANNTKEKNNLMLEQTSDMTLLLFRLLNSELNQTLWDEQTISYLVNPLDVTPQKEYLLSQFMNTIVSKNELIDSMVIYNIGSNRVLYSNGTECALEDAPDAALILDYVPTKDPTYPVDNDSLPMIFSREGQLLLVQDLVLSHPLGTVFMELDVEALYSNLGIDSEEFNAGFYDRDGVRISVSNMNSHLPDTLPDVRLPGQGELTLGQARYIYTRIPGIDWYYLQEYTPALAIALHALLPGLIPGILLFIILGLFITYQITGRIYAPINRLVHLVLERTGNTVLDPRAEQDELDYLRLSFFETIDESQQLQQSMEHFEKDILINIFQRVLEGTALADTGWERISNELRESWENSRQYLILVCNRSYAEKLGTFGNADTPLFLQGLNNQLQKYMGGISWLVIPMGGYTTAILLRDNTSSATAFIRNVDQLQKQLEADFKDSAFPIQLAHGKSHPHLEDIQLSWQEGLQSLRYSSYIQNSAISPEEESPSIYRSYFKEHATRIIHYVTSREQSMAQELLMTTIDELFRTLSLPEERKNCFDAMKEMFLEKLLSISNEEQGLPVITLQDFREKSEEELRTRMMSAFLILMEQLAQSVRKRSYHYMESALRYIQENANDSELSVSMIAEHLHISSSYFSECFNETMQESFTTYLNRLRIDNARKILAETSLPIKDVGFKCGFCTVQHFNRTFKKLTSQTPKQYRDTILEEQENRRAKV